MPTGFCRTSLLRPPNEAAVKAVLQRVTRARVSVGGEIVGEIGIGYLVFLGVAIDDTDADLDYIVNKIIGLRLFPGAGEGKKDFDADIKTVGGGILLVSQFTLLGDCRKGRRPNWSQAAPAVQAEPVYRAAAERFRAAGLRVQEGTFGAMMSVELVNDGPVTLILDSRERQRSDVKEIV